ncbi:conserved hypothetical protein [Vibrio jasicida]|nr:hypothetical protein SN11_23385 [Vibrio harveyi]CAH1531826.1 conserved hypothetical protein [Vibrio jasicida]
MAKGILMVILSIISLPVLSNSKTLIFPVFTEINKALLSDYSIFTSISRDNILLSYSEKEEKFIDEKVIIFNRSTIPTEEVLNYTYRYLFSDVHSSCQKKNDTNVINESFMSVYVNGTKYVTGDKSEPINFDSSDGSGFESRNDILELKNEERISSESPLTCEGEVNFLVELYL